MDEKRKKKGWAILALFLLLSPLALGLGCDPIQTFAYFLLPWVDDKEPPKFPLAQKDKEVTVVLMASLANPLEAGLELQTVDSELCDYLAQTLKRRFAENKEKVNIVPYYKVKSYLNKDANSALIPKREIARHFKADYLINLEIESLRFYLPGSGQQLFQGKTEIMVTVFGADQGAGEGPLYEFPYPREYPRQRPVETSGATVRQFRSLFLQRIAKDLCKYFAAYPHDERYGDIDD